MNDTYFYIACLVLPIAATVWFSCVSYNHLHKKQLLTLSNTSLIIFGISRGIFTFAFGVLTAAFLLGIIVYGVSGEETRLLVATADPSKHDAISVILAEWSNVLLPVIFVSFFIALFALGNIGRHVLKHFPAEGKPGEEFSAFRFTFIMMALSLAFPPLLFGSLLTI